MSTGFDLVCPKCGRTAILGKIDSRSLWVCPGWPECDYSVGCHKGTITPLGTLADGRTRQARMDTHAMFDPLWRDGSDLTRDHAYAEVSKALGFRVHIGEANYDTCMKIQEWTRQRLAKAGRGRLHAATYRREHGR